MELITINHKDFQMFIECRKFNAVWEKAKRLVGQDNLISTYTCSDEVLSADLVVNGVIQIEKGKNYQAVFFDNTDYIVCVEFDEAVTYAQLGSFLKEENEKSTFRRGVLSVFLNYGNDIGQSEIKLIYKKNGVLKEFVFNFTVLSTKLNYYEHWKKIIEDIELEYRMLSLDYMKKTFHSFVLDNQGERPDLIWWSVFSAEQNKFIKAIKCIIERPRHKLHGTKVFQRAEKLKYIPKNIENEIAENRFNARHLYNLDEHTLSNDTSENRFLKYALSEITSKYESLKSRIEKFKNLSIKFQNDLDTTLISLKKLQRHAFFRTVGCFKGLNQASLTLQKATGYCQVYRIWNILKKAYSLNDGIYRLQTKDIATLYEIWCYIEVAHIVKQLLGSDVETDYPNRMEMNNLFTFELGKGEHSRILFKKENVELAELIYNPKNSDKENSSVGIENIVVPTVVQKPDIVLQLSKNEMGKNIKLTYLFDAKYRIDNQLTNGVDTPPDDAINQMHRYRDAIYYKENCTNTLKKEVIGGYILFPGDGEKQNIEKSRFYKTINEVNIGAFPLKPCDNVNRSLLEGFIRNLLEHGPFDILDASIPQKGLFYSSNKPKEAMCLVIAIDIDVNLEEDVIIEGMANEITLDSNNINECKDIQSVRYIVPISSKDCVFGFYAVEQALVVEVKNFDHPTRLKFKVGNWVPFKTPIFLSDTNWSKNDLISQKEFESICRANISKLGDKASLN